MKLRNHLLPLIAALWPATSIADELRIATWNIANLHHETGVPLRDRATAREDIDYERLSNTATGLNADIILLQEIGSPAALARVFPVSNYHLIISDRYQEGDENKPPNERDIFTAVAISKDRFASAPPVTTEHAFSLTHFDIDRDTKELTARPTRAAMVIDLKIGGQEVKLIGLHLKSSCHQYSLFPIEDQNFFNEKPFGSRFDCRTLTAQLAILENWVEAQKETGRDVILAGDFNRRMNEVTRNPTRYEDFWGALNDGNPNGISLTKGPEGKDTVCWPKHTSRFDENIDFIVVDDDLLAGGADIDFEKLSLGHDDDPLYADYEKQRLSDHCPVVVTISN
ncbi:endonuclease/exonuclease/phosphatase family protein [Parasedimentitalea marina]|nr:endonuclease/exonuclease/phosphatase family protein [Parasedimentitalea marina]